MKYLLDFDFYPWHSVEKAGRLCQQITGRETMTAHYFKTRNEQYLIISADCSPVGEKMAVSSKKEAREVSKKLNATPWNF